MDLRVRRPPDLGFIYDYSVDGRFVRAAKTGLLLMNTLDPDRYSFHNTLHPIDVMKDAMKLAVMEGLDRLSRGRLFYSAATHDLGFISVYEKNEAVGAQIAAGLLRKEGGSNEDISVCMEAILSTAWPQNPQTPLECVLNDADVANFGKTGERGFLARGEAFRQERMMIEKIDLPKAEWYRSTYERLRGHRFFTESARKLYGEQEKRNMEELRRLAEASIRE